MDPNLKGNQLTMIASIKNRIGREDEGFTLIELMVVVLIIAILLAIAIPTFLNARNSANARAAQSNLRNALTAEQTVFANTQAFDQNVVNMTAAEGGIQWTTAAPVVTVPNQVGVAVGGATSDVVYLQAIGKDGKCYTIMQSNAASLSFTGYAVTKQSATGTCTLNTPATTDPTTAPSTGSAGGTVGLAGAPATFYTTW
jgi:type IV pilus assembly protein PilA